MPNHFYSHLIKIDSVHEELHKLNLKTHEHEALLTLVDVQIHHVVVDTLLTEFSEDNKKIFLRHLSEKKDREIWEHLDKNIKDAENKIKSAAERLLKELLADITESKKRGK